MKIGLIGCGNMAKAIIEGVIAADLFKKEDIYASALNTQKLTDYCNAVSIRTSSNLEILQKCDIIILAVKPQKFDEILKYCLKSVISLVINSSFPLRQAKRYHLFRII